MDYRVNPRHRAPHHRKWSGFAPPLTEDRYNAAAVLITSQLPLEKWHDVIGEPTFADAILDRIVHNAHRIDLDGPSMRKTIAENINANAVDHVEGK